jgi:predicted HAD superfamily Cof-like phosphohydrolase
MNKFIKDVQKWHKAFKVPVGESPQLIPDERRQLRQSLIAEELAEYAKAAATDDLIGVADALADLMYVLCGTIVEHGLQYHFDEIWNEVQRSNMSKLGSNGQPILREDGKILKGPNYSPPQLAPILDIPANSMRLHDSGVYFEPGVKDRLHTKKEVGHD